MIKLGFLFSRLRVEEKHLIKEIKSRPDIELVMLDSRKLIVGPKNKLNIDVLLDREISQSRALHIVQF